MSNRTQSLTVVGAGLVGSLLSTVLAKLGFDVDIFERRVDMRKETISAGRSINLAMSVRGLYSLQKLGIHEEILKKAIAMPGRIIHPISGKTSFQAYGQSEAECIYSISRAELNKTLMTIAEETQKVKIHFQEKLTQVDFEGRKLKFQNDKTKKETEVHYNQVFGTDGSSSVLRHALRDQFGHEESESILSHGYKELHMAPMFQGNFKMEKHGLHIWPRGSYMLIALPNCDGSFTCTLFLFNTGPLSFESLTTPEKVEAFFKEQFPDVIPLIPDYIDQFFHNPTGQMVTVKTYPWNHKEDIVLLGDAAHAIVPFFGQGMNCGFEDVAVLSEMIEKIKNQEVPWKSIFDEFSASRKPNGDAIADLAVDNFVEMRDRVADKKFLLAKEVEKLLEKRFPEEYVSRYRLVSFTRVPYRIALDAGKRQDKILSSLCEGISSAGDVDFVRAYELIKKEIAPLLKNARTS
ncbi:FAD-dependent monooxygenase [bacterium]|nr:FAD-dependent monooxygenase [bacterium]